MGQIVIESYMFSKILTKPLNPRGAGVRLKTMSIQTIPLKLKYSFYLQKYC